MILIRSTRTMAAKILGKGGDILVRATPARAARAALVLAIIQKQVSVHTVVLTRLKGGKRKYCRMHSVTSKIAMIHISR